MSKIPGTTATVFGARGRSPDRLKNTVLVTIYPDITGDYIVNGTNDHIEINEALIYINSLGGGVVQLREGTYTIAESIRYPGNNCGLEGLGRGAFIDGDGLGNGEHAIVMSGRDDCAVRNLAIQTPDGEGNVIHCVFIEDGSDRFIIDRVIIVDSDSDGIHIEGTNIVTGHIQNCTILDVDNKGIYVGMDAGNSVEYLTVEGCLIASAGDEGIELELCNNSLISNNIIHDSGADGIELVASADYNLINGNICYTNGSDGIATSANTCNQNSIMGNLCINNWSHGINNSSTECIISDNYCYDNSRSGAGNAHGIIMQTFSHRCLIHGNHCSAPGDSQENGIHLTGTVVETTITNNFCYNNRGLGISLSSNSDNSVVVGNYCIENDDAGIWVGTTGRWITISGNNCFQNGQHGINIQGADNAIVGNTCYNNSQTTAGTYDGINIGHADADRCMICNNWIGDDGTNQENGIELIDGVIDCLIDGNYIYNHMGDGINLVANNDNCKITNNYLMDNDDYGVIIQATSCNNNIVKDNYYNGNVTGAISDGGTDTAVHEVFMEITDPNANLVGAHPVILLADGVNRNFYTQWLAPMSFQELVRARGIFVADSAGNMDYWAFSQFGKVCIEPFDMHYASITETTHTFDYSGSLECIDISGALSGILAGDLAGIRMGRGAANAGDTINDDVYYLGLKMEYV